MKTIKLLFIVLFNSACTSNVQQATQLNTEQDKYTIYLNDFEPSGFSYADFLKLKEITENFPERLDTIPKDIGYKLTTQDTNNVAFFCGSISLNSKFYIGNFELRKGNSVNVFYVTFSEKGDILDYLVLKRAKIKKDGEEINWMFNSDVTFFFCEDCFPETIEYISVKTLDTTKEAAHPHVAKVLKTDNWYIDESGMFKLKE